MKWNSNGWINAGLAVGSPIASIGATNYVNGYMENYDKPLQIGITATSGATGGGSDFAIINASSGHWYTVDWSRVGTRVVGALQMVGGAVETILGGVGGVVTSETGVGAVLGYAVAMNGIDNATAGAIQLWTGESQNTLLHKGVSATAVYAGASYDTAERVATYADISTIALGGFASYKGFNSWGGIKATEQGGLNAAKGGETILEGAVKSNYSRFVSKIPANSKASASFELLEDGNYLFKATSPGKVPGSSALYQKWVNPQGETFNMIKTTFAPDGSIIHIKPNSDMRNRTEILKELVLLQGNIEVLEKELSQYPWDIEKALFKINAEIFLSVLKRNINNEIDLETITNWANAIECRDDIEFANDELQEIVFELANPEINGEITKKRLSEIIALLEK